ncbi:bifunctional Nucleic acid-binding [Babesia duncani]|uniref:Bifunctional Nucleic acid-binding n=1 Tax=Babesia duncani TaxID=323732 RepID=A0AAD9PKK9_9APIC|nr:bifunctional Nucleic acid-binding [Babesia duncani]
MECFGNPTSNEASLDEMLSKAGEPKLPISLPSDTVLDEMSSLIKRGVPVNDLKSLFFNPVEAYKNLVLDHDYLGSPVLTEQPEDANIMLFGENCDPDNIDKVQAELKEHNYSIKDYYCQTLISTILQQERNERNRAQVTVEDINTDALAFKEILSDYYVANENGLPDVLYEWNRQYKEGLKNVPNKGVAAYNKLWYGRLHEFMLHVVNKFKTIFEDEFESKIKKHIVDTDPNDKRPKLMIDGKELILPLWSSFLSPTVLEFIIKYDSNSKIKRFGSRKDDIDDFKADLIKAHIAISNDPNYQKMLMYDAEQKRKEYIDFIQNRRSNTRQMIKFKSLPLMPHWIWHEFWRKRSDMVPDTLQEILGDIVLGDPNIDLRQVLDGTLEQFENPELTGKLTCDSKRTLGSCDDLDFSNVKAFVKEHEERKQRLKEQGVTFPSPQEESKYPKPLGYYFKDVLSFKKFKQEYRKFNIEHFGSPDYQLYTGQLVKGKIYRVDSTKMLVDIHAPILAAVYLRDVYETPNDVPLGGFKHHFKPNDELMFEIREIWPHQIVLSLNRVKAFYRCRDILRMHAKNEIFKVRVLQRYTKGLLVHYDGGNLGANLDDIDALDNIGWIPLVEISSQHRHPKQITKIELVGQYIPVVYHRYHSFDDIPILSNTRAIKRMQIMHMKPGDVVKGRIIEYDKDHITLLLGESIARLDVADMSEYTYKNHLSGHGSYDLLAAVKSKNVKSENVELSTKILPEEMDDLNVNSFLKLYRETRDNVKMYNENIHLWSIEDTKSAGIEIMGHGKMALKPIVRCQSSSPEKGVYRLGMRKWNLTGDDYLDEDESFNYWFNKYRWQILTNSKWEDLSRAEQVILNRGYNNFDELLYYRIRGTHYKIDFKHKVRFNLALRATEPIRSIPLNLVRNY